MADNKPVYIISDSPEKDSDLFGFDAYAKTIAELIAHKKNKTPLAKRNKKVPSSEGIKGWVVCERKSSLIILN